MNEVLAALHARKSVRVYTGAPISDADRAAILQAAVAAPTAGCQQLYTILD
ncbi:MAG: nitroreductase family protein, partial [Pseudoflavonifractor sp.]